MLEIAFKFKTIAIVVCLVKFMPDYFFNRTLCTGKMISFGLCDIEHEYQIQNLLNTFIQAFKKVYGISPKKYRMMEDQNEKGS